MGRNGDTLLAHITPQEALLLKKKGGAGTVNPVTGLLEFYDADRKSGHYIWRTSGDSKVRSSHAERDGKTFAWNTPPEGGHPGEALNCRCTAEDVKTQDMSCEELKVLMEEAWDRHDALHKFILNAGNDIALSEQILRDLREKLNAIRLEIVAVANPGRLNRKPSIGDILDVEHKRREIERLLNIERQIEVNIEIEERTRAEAKKKFKQHEHEREQQRQTAEEHSRRYKACDADNEKPGK